MKKILVLLVLLYSEPVLSQNSYSFNGFITDLETQTPISFHLSFTETDGLITGYSITNLNTKNETKSKINGIYFRSDESFQIQENKILHTHSKSDINIFCFITMNLKLKKKSNDKILQGTYSGSYIDSSECSKGIVLLKENNKSKKNYKKNKLISKNNTTSNKLVTLKSEDVLSINLKNNIIKLIIWDGNKEDGDMINLSLNNKLILDNFKASKEKKEFKLKTNKGENTIKITAQNLGTSPPNTTQIELTDGHSRYTIITKLEVNKTGTIKLVN